MSKKNISNDKISEAGKVMLIQDNQKKKVQSALGDFQIEIDKLSNVNDENLNNLDLLIEMAESMCLDSGIDIDNINYDIDNFESDLCELTQEEKNSIKAYEFEKIDIVELNEQTSWNEYINNIEKYALDNSVDLSKDPFESLLSQEQKGEISERIKNDYTMKKANCDKYDYLIGALSGVACGLIDSFFVGMPGASKLGKWTDKKTDDLVQVFAGKVWDSDKKGGANLKKRPDSIGSAIGYLEKRFKVNYDARYASDIGLDNEMFKMSASNHHLKSLGHSPDLIGLFFSVLDQFTGTSSFISNGRIIRVESNDSKFKLQGETFTSRLFCGFCNWIGHIMSDVAGSSGTRGHKDGKRGAGVSIPFFEMFQFCDFGSLNINGESKTFAELSVKIFEEGYDARYGAAMAIPVFLNEVIIRFLWMLKSRFYHKNTWKESIPFGNNPELRRMLLVGHGSLCIVDGIDAGIRSGGNILTFALHLNSVAWSRLAFAGLQEIRMLYKESCLDIGAMDRDLETEWNRLYNDII
ncbi:hypothetical protein ACV3P7_02610 [Clostridium perfringens]|nr:hypothetical protein [Clostridium perfringens]MDM0462731.1 hypothetical protein [Clostridium perfringens]